MSLYVLLQVANLLELRFLPKILDLTRQSQKLDLLLLVDLTCCDCGLGIATNLPSEDKIDLT